MWSHLSLVLIVCVIMLSSGNSQLLARIESNTRHGRTFGILKFLSGFQRPNLFDGALSIEIRKNNYAWQYPGLITYNLYPVIPINSNGIRNVDDATNGHNLIFEKEHRDEEQSEQSTTDYQPFTTTNNPLKAKTVRREASMNDESTNQPIIENRIDSTTLSPADNDPVTEGIDAQSETANQKQDIGSTTPSDITIPTPLTSEKEPKEFNGYAYGPPPLLSTHWTAFNWHHPTTTYQIDQNQSPPYPTPPDTIPLKSGAYENSHYEQINRVDLTTDSVYKYGLPIKFRPSRPDVIKDQIDNSYFMPLMYKPNIYYPEGNTYNTLQDYV